MACKVKVGYNVVKQKKYVDHNIACTTEEIQITGFRKVSYKKTADG
jgi:hypothetical protein